MQTRKLIPIFLAIVLLMVGTILIVRFFITSSQPQATAEPSLDVSLLQTSVVETFSASLTQTQSAVNASITNTPQPTLSIPTVAVSSPLPLPTSGQVFVSPIPTLFLSPTITGTVFTPTTNPANLGVGCNNLRLLRDETIPAGTVIKPGETFTKTWKVENNGSCDWVFQYRLVFIGGERMSGEPAGLGKVIVPGKWTQLSVTLTAPTKGGTYTGTWRLGTQSGSPFGSTLTVSIVVGTPTNTPVPATPTQTSTPVTPVNTVTPSNTPVTPTDTPATSYP